MISPEAEGNVGDVEPLGQVWITREYRSQLEQVLAQQRAGGTGVQQEFPGGKSSQSSEVETSGLTLLPLLTTARREELLAAVGGELLGRPKGQVQLGGGRGRQTLRSELAGTSRLENLERQSFFRVVHFKILQQRYLGHSFLLRGLC